MFLLIPHSQEPCRSLVYVMSIHYIRQELFHRSFLNNPISVSGFCWDYWKRSVNYISNIFKEPSMWQYYDFNQQLLLSFIYFIEKRMWHMWVRVGRKKCRFEHVARFTLTKLSLTSSTAVALVQCSFAYTALEHSPPGSSSSKKYIYSLCIYRIQCSCMFHQWGRSN